jgi:hypothetical protein
MDCIRKQESAGGKTENIPRIYDKTMALEFELNLYLSFIWGIFSGKLKQLA